MESAQLLQSQPPTILFEDWKNRIQMAADVDQLVRVVRAYLRTWKPEELGHLPYDLAAVALMDSEDIVARAVMASRAELKFNGTAVEYAFLREMTLTLVAAGTRLRFLKSFGSRV